MKVIDRLGNVNAEEGCDRCICGCKYWENDKCIDCGELFEITWIRLDAQRARFLTEVKLNVIMTTFAHSLGLGPIEGALDLVETTKRFRLMGAIQ